jgi:glycosyltransferase involved in cell wall biosynthesis
MTNNATAITPMILTYNEAPNIGRVLSKLTWANRIVIIDSYSTDETLAIIAQFPQAEVYQNPFKSFADQCNFGLEKIKSEWVLSLDSDYVLDDKFIDALLHADLDANKVAAYYAHFKYAIYGKPLRGTLYPARKVLYARDRAYYENDGHGHKVQVEGTSQNLDGFIHHDDRKAFSKWLITQDKYLKQEADKLTNTPLSQLSWNDRIRWFAVAAPLVVFFYCLIVKRGILDGRAGWYYAYQRLLAEVLLSIRLIETRFTITEDMPLGKPAIS